MNAGVILFLIFAVCVLIGVPISMSLGIGSLAAVALGNLGVSPAVIAQRVFGGLQSTSIMPLPSSSGRQPDGRRRHLPSYRHFANCLIGNIRGGMSVALVIACAFFAALSGSAPATVVAIGSMLYADMVKQATRRPHRRSCWSSPAVWARSFPRPSSWCCTAPDRCVRHQHGSARAWSSAS